MEASSTLQRARVLVLNASWEPYRVVSWQRAVLLLMGSKIEVLDSYDLLIRSPSIALQVPSVVRMKKFINPKRRSSIVRFSRHHVFLRDDFRCQYCREVFAPKDLTLDHVVPVMRGGKKTWSNIVTCCGDCNQKKGARTPQEAGFQGFRAPREPDHGFIPDLLLLKEKLPQSWRPFLEHLSIFQSSKSA
jgi:5-methylcytosine-specific restriction endonuclease McrA